MKTFCDIDLESVDFILKDFVEYDNSLVTDEMIKQYKTSLFNLMVYYQYKLKTLIKNISSINSITDIIRCDICCFYLYTTYTRDCVEEFVTDDIQFEENEISSLYATMYLEEMAYPRILNILI